MKPRNALWCPRSKHRLAWLEADETGEPVVCIAAVAPGKERLRWGTSRIPAAELDGFTRYATMVGCACKARYDIDMVAVLTGNHQTPCRITDDLPGASFDR